MTSLTLHTDVKAPPQRCFDLARSLDFHIRSMVSTGERIVSGRITGLIGLGEEVEFEARHLGLPRRLRARVSAFNPPSTFTDEQVAERGPFRMLTHTHTFESLSSTETRVTDHLAFDIGRGPLGTAVERRVIRPHLRRLLTRHQQNLKAAAESEAWRYFLEQSTI